MRIHRSWLPGLAALALGVAVRPAPADEPPGNGDEKAAIARNAEAFVEAFPKGDAEALAAFWTADGDYTDEAGRCLKGREAIAKAFRELFAENKDLKLRIESESFRFLTPDVAVEDGVSAVIQPEGTPPNRARYTIVHVKKDGKWQLSNVRESIYAPPTNHERLRDLEWLIGEWAEESGEHQGERLAFDWSENQNFVLGSFTTTARDIPVGNLTLWIGWDPLAKTVRSWMFDATGGFGGGTWTRDGDRWTVKSHAVTREGKKMTATYVLGRVDENTITLQAKDRTLNGNQVPDSKEFKLKRVK